MTNSAIYAELASAVHDLNARGLTNAAKWAGEQLCGLDEEVQAAGISEHASFSDRGGSHPRYLLAKSYFELKVIPHAGTAQQGLACMDLQGPPRAPSRPPGPACASQRPPRTSALPQEYQRAAFVLQGAPGPCAQFIRLYSLFLAGERRKE
jgi:anaphase-promoting complex subunit 8